MSEIVEYNVDLNAEIIDVFWTTHMLNRSNLPTDILFVIYFIYWKGCFLCMPTYVYMATDDRKV